MSDGGSAEPTTLEHRVRWAWLDFRSWWRRELDGLAMKIAFVLPRRLVAWSFIRVVAEGTTGKWSETEVPELRCMDALERWGENDD